MMKSSECRDAGELADSIIRRSRAFRRDERSVERREFSPYRRLATVGGGWGDKNNESVVITLKGSRTAPWMCIITNWWVQNRTQEQENCDMVRLEYLCAISVGSRRRKLTRRHLSWTGVGLGPSPLDLGRYLSDVNRDVQWRSATAILCYRMNVIYLRALVGNKVSQAGKMAFAINAYLH